MRNMALGERSIAVLGRSNFCAIDANALDLPSRTLDIGARDVYAPFLSRAQGDFPFRPAQSPENAF